MVEEVARKLKNSNNDMATSPGKDMCSASPESDELTRPDSNPIASNAAAV